MASERASSQQDKQQGQEDVGLTSRVGLIEVNWPKTIGYYGGIGLALAAGSLSRLSPSLSPRFHYSRC